jgi:hypothetical protein
VTGAGVGGASEEPVDERLALVAAVQAECCRTLAAAWERARMSGLCDEGAWEVAFGALRAAHAGELLRRADEHRQAAAP